MQKANQRAPSFGKMIGPKGRVELKGPMRIISQIYTKLLGERSLGESFCVGQDFLEVQSLERNPLTFLQNKSDPVISSKAL